MQKFYCNSGAAPYKIVGSCPFGTQQVDESGRMDDTQFHSNDPSDYAVSTGARLAIRVAQKYGAKPICVILSGEISVDVYDLGGLVGIVAHDSSGWYATDDTTYRNTVGPLALLAAAQSILQR